MNIEINSKIYLKSSLVLLAIVGRHIRIPDIVEGLLSNNSVFSCLIILVFLGQNESEKIIIFPADICPNIGYKKRVRW